MGVRHTQKAATREKVVTAARDLFHEVGVEETTIRAIAERAGVSVGSVFTTFSSKADILAQVMAERVESLHQELMRVKPYVRGSTADRLCSLFAVHYEFESRRVILFLAHISAAYSPSLEDSTVPFGRNTLFKDMILDVLQDGITRGDIRPDADLDLTLDTLMAVYSWNYRLAAQKLADAKAMTAIMERQIHLLVDGLRHRPPASMAL